MAALEYAQIRPQDRNQLTLAYVRKFVHQRTLRALQRIKTKFEINTVAASLPPSSFDYPSIAVHIAGGVGDCVVAARFLRDLQTTAGPFRFSVFCENQKAANWVFGKFDFYDGALSEFLFNEPKIRECFAAAFDVRHTIQVEYEGKLHARLERIVARIKNSPSWEMHPKDHMIAAHAVSVGESRETFLNWIAGVPYGGKMLFLPSDDGIFERINLSKNSYVTINNGFDNNLVIGSHHSTKNYPHAAELVAEIKAINPGLTIVQLGGANSIPISDVDVQLAGKTSLEEATAILKHSKLHIDNEGGLVHVAQCLDLTCCVLFGPTSRDYFGYKDNINIEPAVCGNCWWKTRTWMDVCALGETIAPCLRDRSPRDIIARIQDRLNKV